MDELPFDHEDSLNHMAKRLADDDIATGYHTDWHHAYENAWEYLEREMKNETNIQKTNNNTGHATHEFIYAEEEYDDE